MFCFVAMFCSGARVGRWILDRYQTASLPRLGKPSDYLLRCDVLLRRQRWPMGSRSLPNRFAPSAWKAERLFASLRRFTPAPALADGFSIVAKLLRSLGLESRATIYFVATFYTGARVGRWVLDRYQTASLPRLGKPSDYLLRCDVLLRRPRWPMGSRSIPNCFDPSAWKAERLFAERLWLNAVVRAVDTWLFRRRRCRRWRQSLRLRKYLAAFWL